MLKIGSLDSTWLQFDRLLPHEFVAHELADDGTFKTRLGWWALLDWRRWIRAVRNRANWRLDFHRHPWWNNRCYCQRGSSAFGAIQLCGFGIVFWISSYPGPIPCECDRLLAALD